MNFCCYVSRKIVKKEGEKYKKTSAKAKRANWARDRNTQISISWRLLRQKSNIYQNGISGSSCDFLEHFTFNDPFYLNFSAQRHPRPAALPLQETFSSTAPLKQCCKRSRSHTQRQSVFARSHRTQAQTRVRTRKRARRAKERQKNKNFQRRRWIWLCSQRCAAVSSFCLFYSTPIC